MSFSGRKLNSNLPRAVATAEAEEAAASSVFCRVRQRRQKLSKICTPGSIETGGGIRLGTGNAAKICKTALYKPKTHTPVIKVM